MERLDYQQAEEEANEIRELAGENPTSKAYELAHQLNEAKENSKISSLDTPNLDDQEVRLRDLKRKIKESGVPELGGSANKSLSTPEEIFSAFAPEEATGTGDDLCEAGKKAFIKWFLNTEGLPFFYKTGIKKRMRSEDEIIGLLLAHGLVENEVAAREFIQYLSSAERFKDELSLKLIRDKKGDWVYSLVKPKLSTDDDL